jgi:hypothetical protein
MKKAQRALEGEEEKKSRRGKRRTGREGHTQTTGKVLHFRRLLVSKPKPRGTRNNKGERGRRKGNRKRKNSRRHRLPSNCTGSMLSALVAALISELQGISTFV